MAFVHSSSDIEPDLGPIVMTEKKVHSLEVIEESSPSHSLQLLQPPPQWKYAKFFPGGYSPNRQVPCKGKSMTWAVNIVAGIAIMFYGFDQGVMSGVNITPNYQEEMGIFSQPQTEGNAAKIGGLLIWPVFSLVFQGAFVGALIGGILGDRIGRLKAIVFACFWAIIGAALQASAQNVQLTCCARVITGIGTGQLNALVPVWTSELSHHSGRGAAMGLELMLNIAGLATAYWIEFGLRGANQELRWRLPLALQVGFLLVLLFLVPLFPESPRWLAKMGRDEDAREILSVLRHHNGDSPEELSGRPTSPIIFTTSSLNTDTIPAICFLPAWLTVPWLVPTEIMPLYARAKGGCWSVVGWSIGNGIVTEIAPFLFNAITHWTFILFSAINFFTLPNVYFLLPETAGRSLEDMNILFESDSIFVHKAKHIDRPIKRIDLDDPPVLAAHPEALA
ncbi:hypothetical protein PSTG_06226 [Puccinia striiformis f. sp. tritici PST-78]|uniref:Major facilitator superfamily (MFS) profile domain-containing protein n=1 Tax=Puccinia striiformis f. sp. tritici PST-78 TaxID=1165861 RepID=A0A0L0VMN4_9BASI|nr:hypothetical protein PSTG_06226 [Puccinia striiformis f. sp. tritici PST-78]